MTFLDWILIILLISFIFSGFKGGLIYSLGTLLGIVVGALVAGRLYEPLAGLVGNDANWAKIAAFLLVFVVVNQLIGLIFYVINKVVKIAMIIPFLGLINRLGGAIFGFIEGILFLGISLFFITRFDLADKIVEILGDSSLVPMFARIGKALAFLLPEVVKGLDLVI
ncbi:MAG: hypothetical protein COY66_02215 [Candidatus Kerfeldbacteria bacterium CG_4_10_14_0_8_um_filter_42_10]|uniref:Colicin V production protein n=1 Tax=Candidatus Kerfeldbacteria bacterium CG_4_10_14_0_8_um_filter_42_10 TaxID=2014248 RepID=A0A2M7RJL8_9BACT|nr:MAG: hypothetical protein COY66_02215 [Candidatus Kerfeldbacteria bacterium CG_4_10_14_0_8_um_filter_42_10]